MGSCPGHIVQSTECCAVQSGRPKYDFDYYFYDANYTVNPDHAEQRSDAVSGRSRRTKHDYNHAIDHDLERAGLEQLERLPLRLADDGKLHLDRRADGKDLSTHGQL